MAQGVDAARWKREVEAVQRRAQAQIQREVDRVNRENQRKVDDYNRKVRQHNQQALRDDRRRVDDYNRRATQHNQRVISNYNREVGQVNAHNHAVVAELSRQARSGAPGPQYTVSERDLADRVQQSLARRDEREWDVFLSYAPIDGATVGDELRLALEEFGVRVWFDEVAITPGRSQSRQMDFGLQKARAGVVLLTPAYLAGRFWTERELGALLHNEVTVIAQKIATAVIGA